MLPVQVVDLARCLDGNTTDEADTKRSDPGPGGVESGNGREDSTEVPAEEAVAEPDAEAATRANPSGSIRGVWEEIQEILGNHPTVQAKTMFEHLCRKHPGRFQEGQLRSLQRRFKQWRVRSGPEREVMFPQVYDPGRWQCQSDFTHMGGPCRWRRGSRSYNRIWCLRD